MTQSIMYTRWLAGMIGLLILSLLPVYAGAVDINHAGAKEIADELIQIGPAKAQDIVDYRKKHGAFSTVDDLQKVPGIGSRILEMNREKIEVKSAAARTMPDTRRASPSASGMAHDKTATSGQGGHSEH